MSLAIVPRRALAADSADRSELSNAERPEHVSAGGESASIGSVSSAEARHALIAEAAYRRAELRGFLPGEDLQDWFAAEREVDALLGPDL